MKNFNKLLLIISIMTLISCKQTSKNEELSNDEFEYFTEQFADIKILRFKVDGFEALSLQQKIFIYYLSEAALCGRDIIFDQYHKHNLIIRKTLEEIYAHYEGDRETDEFKQFMVYLKRLWFSHGIHHHYSTDKILPDFSESYFKELLKNSPKANWPVENDVTYDEMIQKITPFIFNPELDAKRVNLDAELGLIKGSANNFYENLSREDVINFYEDLAVKGDTTPVEYGLNTKLQKENGQIVEKTWKLGGMYSNAIEKIIYWLEKAATVAENEKQKEIVLKLISYYQTGDLQKWDEYNILWVQDTESQVDFINGFIEVYGDPLGIKGTWEALVNFRDEEATKRTQIISENAQWFEDNSPVDGSFKKKKVKGVSAKVITVAQIAGDCYPSTPIGINLPNSNWVRTTHGSKSVTIGNIIHSHHMASMSDGFLEEFAFDDNEIELAKKYGALGTDLHVDIHECLGHGSGKLLSGVSSDALKSYLSALEEARADLFSLYYIMDPQLVTLGLTPNLEVGKALYNSYIRGGMMTQLVRIELGKDIEESHMRNRQIIAKWAYEKGKSDKVIEKVERNGKSYFIINDYEKLRSLFSELLTEVQRIKSEGDFEAGKKLVENYGVKIDLQLHKEVKERYEKLKLAPYSGFINPVIKPVMKENRIIDISIEYPNDFSEQMMYYSKNYSY